jgi:hypothetical protein
LVYFVPIWYILYRFGILGNLAHFSRLGISHKETFGDPVQLPMVVEINLQSCQSEWALIMYATLRSMLHQIFCHKLVVAGNQVY